MFEMIEVLQRIASANATSVRQGLPLGRLRALDGMEFRGVRGGDPTCAKYWLEGVTCILGQMGCSNKDKHGCAVSFLDSEAHHWWVTIEHGTAPERVDWDFFLEPFQIKSMRKQYLEARREFMDLVQAQSAEVFEELVEKARPLEETLGEEPKVITARTINRSSESASGSGWKAKRGRFGRHPGECWRLTGACISCGSMEHRIKDCPRRVVMARDQPAATTLTLARGRGCSRSDSGRGFGQRGVTRVETGGPARVYAVRKPQTREATDVIAGTFTLQSFSLLALVDSGATRSFILRDVARELGIFVETSRLGVTVRSPLGDSVVVD
ncbi:ATP-dependent zinc metalloprotease FtsH [Gossypium australe]|uniref:ATP-dependent zinc metalloprotease FtsH n=1 Tax=Gossypium australe TaxID=47621 RepID=A0A5B6VMX4_9ROSI|nr:ATP-dependent zinc metalloprotease FtsH [Gossypium australe]